MCSNRVINYLLRFLLIVYAPNINKKPNKHKGQSRFVYPQNMANRIKNVTTEISFFEVILINTVF